MNICKVFRFASVMLLTIYGCAGKENKTNLAETMLIRLNSDSSAVELVQLPGFLSEELEDDAAMDSLWHNFFAVYQETADPEMRDFLPPLEGVYELSDSTLRFTPEKSFGKGKYFARCYTPEILQHPEDLIRTRDITSNQGYIELRFNIN